MRICEVTSTKMRHARTRRANLHKKNSHLRIQVGPAVLFPMWPIPRGTYGVTQGFHPASDDSPPSGCGLEHGGQRGGVSLGLWSDSGWSGFLIGGFKIVMCTVVVIPRFDLLLLLERNQSIQIYSHHSRTLAVPGWNVLFFEDRRCCLCDQEVTGCQFWQWVSLAFVGLPRLIPGPPSSRMGLGMFN